MRTGTITPGHVVVDDLTVETTATHVAVVWHPTNPASPPNVVSMYTPEEARAEAAAILLDVPKWQQLAPGDEQSHFRVIIKHDKYANGDPTTVARLCMHSCGTCWRGHLYRTRSLMKWASIMLRMTALATELRAAADHVETAGGTR